MKTDTQVVIIGGGIVGASLLYCLAKLGWTDTLLIERRELTSGSTWHAAGNTTYFGPYAQMTRLFAGSIRTYLNAEADSGESIGFHQTGSLRVATTPRERELFHQFESMYKDLQIPYHVVENSDINRLHPCVNTDGLFGAAHTPTDGHVDPTGTTNALAKAAQKLGASIQRQCPVEAIHHENGSWLVHTKNGKVRTLHVVMAASFWSRELLQPLGINIPLYATEHHELITESIPALAAMDHEVPAYRDSVASVSVRQEQDGLLAGVYESDPVFWALDGIPKDFKEELLPPNIDRLLPHLEKMMHRLPEFAEAGVKTINNGPMCWTPDGLPMLGPIGGTQGLWLASGFNVGIGTGGGSAEFLAHWMVNGKPHFELPIVHADRFGNDMTQEAALESIRACYRQGYRLPDTI
jgi:glycine/D-amino acid oxidase-like deaminating enzyme